MLKRVRAGIGSGLLVAASCGVSPWVQTGTEPAVELSESWPGACDPDGRVANLDFILEDIYGEDVALGDYRGQVVLLDFWATWCAPCKIEIPGFVELYHTYRSEGFSVLGVSVDDPVDELKAFAQEFEMNYPVLIGAGRDDVKEAFGPLYGFPTTFIIARDGKICAQHTGFVPKEQFEAEIRALL